jgi:hypothetical protein
VIVAALGLYVISDLRLQADEDQVTTRPRNLSRLATADAPSNSTAAFMATVTHSEKKSKFPSGLTFNGADTRQSSKKKYAAGSTSKESGSEQLNLKAEDARTASPDQDLGAAPSSTTEQESAVVEGAGSPPTVSSSQPVTATAAPGADSAGAPAAVSNGQVTIDPAPQTVALTQPLAPPHDPAATIDQFAWPTPPTPPEQGDVAPVTAATAAAPVGGPSDGSADGGEASADEATSEATPVGEPDGYRVELMATPATAAHDPAPAATETWSRQIPLDVELVDERSLEDPVPESGVQAMATTTLSIPLSGRSDQVVSAADYADAPLAPIIDLRGPATIETDIESAIRSGEIEVVASLIEQGMLSTAGPISDREVRTMVYVAFTSNELRKLLRAGGQPDNPNRTIDLGPVELFDPKLHKPAPARLYSGLASTNGEAGHEGPSYDGGELQQPQRQLG